MRIKNIASGIRGFHDAKHGLVNLEPGQEVDDAELTAAERESAESTGYFEIDGEATAGPASDPDDPTAALDKNSVGELTDMATAEGVDVDAIEGTGANGRVLKADLVAAIVAKRAAPAKPADELDGMDDATLRATVQAITGTEPAADATREQMLAAARGDNT